MSPSDVLSLSKRGGDIPVDPWLLGHLADGVTSPPGLSKPLSRSNDFKPSLRVLDLLLIGVKLYV